MSDPSLRDTIAAQLDSAESATPAPEATPAVETAAPEAATPTETAAQTEARARDASGRFAPKSATPAPKPAEAAPTVTPKIAQPTATQTPAPAAQTPTGPELRAPQSWRPEVREKWNALPLEAKQALFPEIQRREKEISTAMQEAADARKFREQFDGLVNPYRALMSGEPLQAVQGLLQTAAQLRTAPPAHKAQLVAQIVKTYGVPIEALDAALAGEAMPAQAQQQAGPPPQWRDPRLDALLQQAQQRQVHEAARAISEFASKNEFAEDLRESMASLLSGGLASDLQDAYDKAAKLHPEVSKVLEQRRAAQAAATATAATQQARAAGSSVRSQPAVAVAGNGPKDLRSTLEAAYEAAAGRT
jgi:hypothetical protein